MSGVIGGKFLNEIKSIDLFITEKCNMNCDYCFHPKKADTLTIEQGKKILDRMKELSPESLQVTFFGGEPLLYPETVLDLSKYAVNLWGKDNCSLHISTNGTYFNEEIFSELSKLPVSIQVSIDGDEVTTKEHRGGDFNLLVDNIWKIKKFFPNLSARMTVTPKTVGRLSINVEFIHSQLGITKIMHHAVMEADWLDEDVQKYQYQLNQLYHYRRYCQRVGIPLHIAFIDKPLRILNDEEPITNNFCEAGKSYIAILTNGDVYPCHRAASSRIFKLGNIFDKIPFIRGIFKTIDKNYTGCTKNCLASSTCHSCIITHYKVNGELTKPISKYCKMCQVEHIAASNYLPAEISDRHERKLNSLSKVISDLVEQNEQVIDVLHKMLILNGVKDVEQCDNQIK